MLCERCPNAVLVINWFLGERLGATLDVPPARWRWVDDGGTLDVGDRVLHAVCPPIYDSPTTRGLFDPTTGVYWASDGFAAPMPTPVADVADLDDEEWEQGLATFGQYLGPWLHVVDDALYQRTVDRVEQLGASVIASCHSPVISGADRVARAIEVTRRTPTMTVDPQPGQAALEELQRALATQG